MTLSWAEAHGTSLFVGSDTGDLWRWDLETGESVLLDQLGSFVVRIRCIGDHVWVGLRDGRLVELDASHERVREVEAHEGGLFGLAAHAGGKLLITGGGDGWARVWNTEADELEKVAQVGSGESKHQVRAVAFLPDDGIIIGEKSGFFEAFARLGEERLAGGNVFRHGGVSAIAANGEGTRAYFGCSRGAIRVVDTSGDPWKNCDTYAKAPPKQIATNAFAWSRDGRWLAAACSDDSPLRLDTQRPLYPRALDQVFWIRSPKPAWTKKFIVSSVCFDDAGWLYAAVFDGSVRIYGPPDDVLFQRRAAIVRSRDALKFARVGDGPGTWQELRGLA